MKRGQAMLRYGVLATLLVVVGLLAAAPISCTDFFWHLELGELILTQRAIPEVDTFSAVHPSAPYVQPQWLWEVMAAWVHGAAGLAGIRAMQAMLLTGTFALAFVVARKLTRDRDLALLVCATALLTFMDRFRARPDALTLGFVVLSMPLLLTNDGSARARFAAVFGLALLWGNMHGGSGLLLVLSFGALFVGTLVASEAGQRKQRAFELALAALGLALSPTLIPGLIHWVSLIGPQIETGNEEWLPTYTILRYGVTPTTVLIVLAPTLVSIVYAWQEARRVREGGALHVGEWLLCGGYLVLSQLAIRNVVLCVLPLVCILRAWRAAPRVWPVLLSLLLVLLVAEDALRSFGGYDRVRAIARADLSPGAYPEQAGEFLHEAGIEGGIFNEGSWGGYLIWRTFPKGHVFVDTRQNLTENMWQVFLASRSAVQRTQALEYAFRTWGLELAVFKAPTFPLLEPPSTWMLLYRAGDQEVYQRRGGAHETANLARTERYLRAHGGAGEPLTKVAIDVGARAWLSEPDQLRAMASAEQLIARPSAEEKARGLRERAGLRYRAGLYREASADYAEAQSLAPLVVPELYFAAMSAYGAGDAARARTLVALLDRSGQATALTKRQEERLMLLRDALRASSAPR